MTMGRLEMIGRACLSGENGVFPLCLLEKEPFPVCTALDRWAKASLGILSLEGLRSLWPGLEETGRE